MLIQFTDGTDTWERNWDAVPRKDEKVVFTEDASQLGGGGGTPAPLINGSWTVSAEPEWRNTLVNGSYVSSVLVTLA